jgi:hypothetical protein
MGDNISFAPTNIESQTLAPTGFACEKKEHSSVCCELEAGPFPAQTRSRALLFLDSLMITPSGVARRVGGV